MSDVQTLVLGACVGVFVLRTGMAVFMILKGAYRKPLSFDSGFPRASRLADRQQHLRLAEIALREKKLLLDLLLPRYRMLVSDHQTGALAGDPSPEVDEKLGELDAEAAAHVTQAQSGEGGRQR
ncbi:hypothetical protein [Streptomonospora litoralis]|uniref:Uncharacterized protein n=1 Tax=Streptomonospora litoralis TaxID=2498135 RepID=A0A4P6QAM0_9ACTN|nr:hypothetical protein [Streptomonospora litoralis]QBI56327.1 hypothetical protein EKD16_22870 [Streptomonospora litoralis]